MPLTDRNRQELYAILALLAGLFVGLTLLPVNLTGPAGRLLGRLLLTGLGSGAVFIPLFGIAIGLTGFGWLERLDMGRLAIFCGGMIVLLPYAIAMATGVTTSADFEPAWAQWTLGQQLVGLLPALITVGISSAIGTAGAVIVGVLGFSGVTILTFDWHPFEMLKEWADAWGERRSGAQGLRGAGAQSDKPSDAQTLRRSETDRRSDAQALRRSETDRRSDAQALRRSRKRSAAADEHALDQLPDLDLLQAPNREAFDAGEEELEHLGEVLIDTLGTFRVEGRIVGRTTGPVVTQYEVAPAPGVKVGRIAALADDLALAMRAQSIRIVAPIPGKAAVGVEVPNPVARIVQLRELFEAPEWETTRGTLPIALGRDLEGRPVIADLAKMPHLLIAGATGSGKSVCINTIITSLIYRYTPVELRMLMIDPKMVELSGYNELPHLRHPVVTNNKEAAQALKWAVHEMERRYGLFNANGARNIEDLNRKVTDGKELVLPTPKRRPGTDDAQEELPLPYEEGLLAQIVVIVDELADLMMTVQSEVEKPLALLAQKARATGIHLVLATQRPSVNVITGLIKANFPSRIAFRVASKVDSRTILDQNGAEALLGNGDMLFLPPGKSEPTRLQGAFISTEETEDLTGWYADQRKLRDEALEQRGLVAPETRESDILEVIEAIEASEGADGAAVEVGDRDALFREAAETCLQHQLGSTSLLQRKLRIGYGRAARIIDQLEAVGILGPPDGSKPREVLIGAEQLDEYSK